MSSCAAFLWTAKRPGAGSSTVGWFVAVLVGGRRYVQRMVQSWPAVDALSALVAGIDGLLAVEPVGDLACGELLRAMLRERDRFDAAVHRMVVLADAAGTAQADGAASMAGWLAWRGRLHPGEAAGLARTARR